MKIIFKNALGGKYVSSLEGNILHNISKHAFCKMLPIVSLYMKFI